MHAWCGENKHATYTHRKRGLSCHCAGGWALVGYALTVCLSSLSAGQSIININPHSYSQPTHTQNTISRRGLRSAKPCRAAAAATTSTTTAGSPPVRPPRGGTGTAGRTTTRGTALHGHHPTGSSTGRSASASASMSGSTAATATGAGAAAGRRRRGRRAGARILGRGSGPAAGVGAGVVSAAVGRRRRRRRRSGEAPLALVAGPHTAISSRTTPRQCTAGQEGGR
jgi:hypothetical protein